MTNGKIVEKENKMIQNSINHIFYKSNDLYINNESFDDFVFNLSDKELEYEGQFLQRIKYHILKEYRKKDILISQSALDHIIFYEIKKSTPQNLINNIINSVSKNNLNKRSVILFPIHSFGINNMNYIYFTDKRPLIYTNDNFAIVPQTNSLSKTKEIIRLFLDNNKMKSIKFDESMIDHYFKYRNMKWLERNPLLIIIENFSQYDRFDNLWQIIEKIEFITIQLYFYHIITDKKNKNYTWSTSKVNHWATLDINHFLTLTRCINNHKKLEVNLVPIYFKDELIFDISFLNIDITLDFHHKKKNILDQSFEVIDLIQKGYLDYKLFNNNLTQRYQRLTISLRHLKKSIKSISIIDKIINLNTAFEIIYLDNYEFNKKTKMLERYWKCIKQFKLFKKEYSDKIMSELIEERNSIIHSGIILNSNIDLYDHYKIYVYSIVAISNKITENSNIGIGSIIDEF